MQGFDSYCLHDFYSPILERGCDFCYRNRLVSVQDYFCDPVGRSHFGLDLSYISSLRGSRICANLVWGVSYHEIFAMGHFLDLLDHYFFLLGDHHNLGDVDHDVLVDTDVDPVGDVDLDAPGDFDSHRGELGLASLHP